MVDDPSSVPEEFPTKEAQENERLRLFSLISKLSSWESTSNQKILSIAQKEILKTWKRCCADNIKHPQAADLFNPEILPGFHDPFAGGGALPIEAQRLGLDTFASDINPVAVLINKAMLEIPSKFHSTRPVNPETDNEQNLINESLKRYSGLVSDIRYYSRWISTEAEKRIGSLYPKVLVTEDLVCKRADLKPYQGRTLTVISWLWARTVESPDPALQRKQVPLISTYILSSKKGKEAYIEPSISGEKYSFTVRKGKPEDRSASHGTKIGRGAFKCILSGTPMNAEYLREQFEKGRSGQKLIAIVLEGDRERIYIDPSSDHEQIALGVDSPDVPETEFFEKALGFRVGNYGMKKWRSLFTNRQLLALKTFSELVEECHQLAKEHASKSTTLENPQEYAAAIALYMAFCVDRLANRLSTLCIWNRIGEKIEQVFKLQVLSMTWDFAEANVFSNSTGGWSGQAAWIPESILNAPYSSNANNRVMQADAQKQGLSSLKIISTDPPYFDNIGYSDLSDYFYYWLRQSLKTINSKLLGTLATPKSEELVATPARHGGKDAAYKFFLDGMTAALSRSCGEAHPCYPSTIYYAFKQTISTRSGGQTSTGWESFLEAVIKSGLCIQSTWPTQTERSGGVRDLNRNSLSTSLVLSCTKRPSDAPSISKIEFERTLRKSLEEDFKVYNAANIPPVDLPQAIVGAGIQVYSTCKSVTKRDDSRLSVKEAIELTNKVLEEMIYGEDNRLDSATLFALNFFESYRYSEQPFGDAEKLAKALNVSVESISRSGMLYSAGGKVKLIERELIESNSLFDTHSHLCVWIATQHLIRTLVSAGEASAAALLGQLKNLPGQGELAANCRALAYRLYNHCEKTKQTEEARAYNGLVIAWPELERLAASQTSESPVQTSLI